MDKIATIKNKMLLEYEIGINSDIIEFLVLKNRTDIEYSFELKEYIDKRNLVNNRTSLIYSKDLEDSFGVKFVENSEKKDQILVSITDHAKQIELHKIEEIKRCKEKYKELMEKYNSPFLKCECISQFRKCKKCKLKKEADELEVEVFQYPLPINEFSRNAILFELVMPVELAHLRDALHFVKTKLLGFDHHKIGDQRRKKKVISKWIECPIISNEFQKRDFEYKYMFLGVHNTEEESEPSEPLKKHPEAATSFIIENHNKTIYSDNANYTINYSFNSEKLQKNLVYKINEDSSYASLQWAMNDQDENENKVISEQNKCPSDLKLKEFIKFGSFRVGKNLLSYNLLASLKCEDLSYARVEVFSLICQSIYQMGPILNKTLISHKEFIENERFLLELHETIEYYLKLYSNKWNDHIIILNMLIIILRCISLCERDSVVEKMKELLLLCRKITIEWSNQLKNLIESHQEHNINRFELLQEILAIVSCYTIKTYETGEFKSDEDVLNWLNAWKIILKFENYFKKTDFASNLRREVELCMLINEKNIKDYFSQSKSTYALTQFVKLIWSDSSKGIIKNEWYIVKNQKQSLTWFETSFSKNDDRDNQLVLKISIIGQFLVNNKQIGQVPDKILQNEIYKIFFDEIKFDVMPSSSINSYVTDKKKIEKLNQFISYEFVQLPNENVIIKERREKSSQIEEYFMIPNYIMKDYLPNGLCCDYSHWFNLSTNKIEFRAKKYSDLNYHEKIYLEFDLETSILSENTQKHIFISTNSETFSEINEKIANRLEDRQHVYLFTEKKCNESEKVIIIELPRIGLSFEIDLNTKSVNSNEYKGMKVMNIQNITDYFPCLQKGLIICNDSDYCDDYSKKLLLVPNGNIIINVDEHFDNFNIHSYHQITDINLDNINEKQTKYFCYEIDNRLKRLVAEESLTAWLYLACLFGYSSHLIPSKFSQITGTEMALDLLQSPVCWSCKPLNKASLDVLIMISKLTPNRKLMNNHWEQISWPNGLPSMVTHEAFSFLVNKIIKESEYFAFGYIDSNNSFKPTKLTNDGKLNMKAYYRYLQYYNVDVTSYLDLEKNVNPILFERENFDLKIFKNIGKVDCLPNQKYSFEKIFSSFQIYSDKFDKKKFKIESNFNSKSLMNFFQMKNKDLENIWYDLYDLSIKQNNDYNQCRLSFILSIFAYKGDIETINNIMLFQFIRKNGHYFSGTNMKNLNMEDETIKNKRDELFNKLVRMIKKSKENTNKRRKLNVELNPDQIAYEILNNGENSIDNLKLTIFGYEFNETTFREIKNLLIEWHNSKFKILIKDIRKILDDDRNNFNNQTNFNNKFTFNKWDEKINNFKSSNSNSNTNIKQDIETRRRSILNLENVNEIDLKKYKNVYETGCINSIDNINQNTCNNIGVNIKLEQIEFPFKDYDKKCKLTCRYYEELENSWNKHIQKVSNHNTNHFTTTTIINKLNKMKIIYEKEIQNIYQLINLSSQVELNKFSTKSLKYANMLVECTPNNLIKEFLDKSSNNQKSKILIGALLVIFTLHQHTLRCITHFKNKDEQMLNIELLNIPYEKWSPKKRPEWIIFQLESNVTIRNVQVRIAENMIDPPNGKSTVMQLNMGQGKSSIIVPLIASTLSNRTNPSCLVTLIVLKSLLNTNYLSLVQKLGQSLNKRIYMFPCRRDMHFDFKKLERYEKLLYECKNKQGIVLTLSEYCLSFRLKVIEKCSSLKCTQDLTCKESIETKLMNIEKWLKENSRFILDESDEILSVKYKLVYSIGTELIVPGGDMRWKLASTVLKAAKNSIKNFCGGKSNKQIEYISDNTNTASYPKIRLKLDLLKNREDKIFYHRFCAKIAENIIHQHMFFDFTDIDGMRNDLINFMVKQEVDSQTRESLENLFGKDTQSSDNLLIIRGFLAYDILYSVLSKRYRVNYGINKDSNRLLQAVPYKAKDLPSETAQFAHTDIFIMLTYLSYYYNGLNEKQLDDLFELLDKDDDKNEIYNEWINYIPETIKIDDSIKRYASLNLSDSTQKLFQLYPLMKNHQLVIDYWLSKFVFPKEAKEHKQKLEASAWDICSNDFPSTGFSGTNDSRFHLPLNVSNMKNDDMEMDTNGQLIYNLLLPENSTYSFLNANESGKIVVDKIAQIKEIRLLLDAGALMVEMSNKCLIEYWLSKLGDDVKAGVYFEKNDLVVFEKSNGRITPFEMSSFKHQLNSCVIYLDDVHTRGTDLKIPIGSVGAVTLGKDMTKDKLVQACMRMRKLGNGHCVCFYASNECHLLIEKCKSDKTNGIIGSYEVIKWAINNTIKQTIDNYLYWAMNGFSYIKRRLAYLNFQIDNDIVEYTKSCKEEEDSNLKKLYFDNLKEQEIFKIVEAKSKLYFKEGFIIDNDDMYQMKENIKKNIEIIGNKKKYSNLMEEEKEMELEIEIEEEREINRPINKKPCKPNLEDDVKLFYETGVFKRNNKNVFLPFMQSFKNLPNIYSILQEKCWSENVFITNDFLNTVEDTEENFSFCFLRSPRYLLVSKQQDKEIILFLSSYEADKLLSLKSNKSVYFGMILPRTNINQKNRLISFSDLQISPLIMEQLAVFSGSLYVHQGEEEETFLSFFGYCKPQSLKESYQKDFLLANGFVKFENRNEEIFSTINKYCKFVNDPSGLIHQIVETRNYGVVPNSAYHKRFVLEEKKSTQNTVYF